MVLYCLRGGAVCHGVLRGANEGSQRENTTDEYRADKTMSEDRLKELRDRGFTGLDCSPGDSLCYWAHGEIITLRGYLALVRKEVEQLEKLLLDNNICPGHSWHLQDDSYDHEYGTEVIRYWMCEKCGETKPTSSADFGDPEP